MHRTTLRHRCGRHALARIAALIAAVLPLAVAATPGEKRPRIYALTHATVVVEPGRTLEDATVILRDGLIEAVGTGLTPPTDAVEIDGSGKWVYAGLIDADSDLGQKSERPQTPSGPPSFGQRRETPAGAGHPLALIRPETAVRDRLQPFEGDRARAAERLRKLGFTAVLSRPDSGVLRGRSVAVLLADDTPVPEMILRDNVAQHASFQRGRFGQGYPTSLMGAAAALRQTLLDAERQVIWAARYADDPSGMTRPEQHATWEALAPVIAGNQPVVFHTDSPHDTLLADRLGREFGLDVLIATGSHEWEVAERVAATGRGLIVSAGFPDKPDVDEDDEALDVNRDEMRRYLEAAGGPARLHAAGIRFALTLRGLDNNADLPKQMRKMLDAGLSPEVALAAWTTVPAGFIGIDRVVGTVEVGKIANLIVTTGALFDEDTEVEQVFVDGLRYEIEVKEKPQGDPNAVVDPRGEWSVVFDMFGRTVERTWNIAGEAGAYTGTAETQAGDVDLESVELAGNVMTVVFPSRGGRPPMEVVVIIEGDAFEGNAEMGPRTVEMKGTRTSGPEGGAR